MKFKTNDLVVVYKAQPRRSSIALPGVVTRVTAGGAVLVKTSADLLTFEQGNAGWSAVDENGQYIVPTIGLPEEVFSDRDSQERRVVNYNANQDVYR